jgi:hypothetical protein
MATNVGSYPGTAHSREIARERCEELLAGHTTGRVAWSAPEGPELLPVTYAWDNNTVVFRTSPYGVLSQLAQGRCKVAFEIDDIDQENGIGWSVLVRGTSSAIVQPYDLVKLWSMDTIVPWAPGTRNVFIAITPRTISGRSVKAPFAD